MRKPLGVSEAAILHAVRHGVECVVAVRGSRPVQGAGGSSCALSGTK